MTFLKKLANWRVILGVFIVYLGFSIFLFPFYETKIDAIAGGSLIALDLRMQYSSEEVDLLFYQMGEEGRSISRIISGRIDMAFPIVYGLFLLLLILNLGKRFQETRWIFLLPLPILAMVYDYFENFCILRMLAQYPEVHRSLVQISNWASLLKWVFVIASMLAIVILGIIRLLNYWTKSRAVIKPLSK